MSVNRNAEELKERLADLNEMSGPVFKITNDPRVTAVGKFIRKTSIDELPQLLNVFKGDMRTGDDKGVKPQHVVSVYERHTTYSMSPKIYILKKYLGKIFTGDHKGMVKKSCICAIYT